MQRVSGLSHIPRQNAVVLTHVANRFGVVREFEFLALAAKAVVNEFNVRTHIRGFSHLRQRHGNGLNHGMSLHHVPNALPARYS